VGKRERFNDETKERMINELMNKLMNEQVVKIFLITAGSNFECIILFQSLQSMPEGSHESW